MWPRQGLVVSLGFLNRPRAHSSAPSSGASARLAFPLPWRKLSGSVSTEPYLLCTKRIEHLHSCVSVSRISGVIEGVINVECMVVLQLENVTRNSNSFGCCEQRLEAPSHQVGVTVSPWGEDFPLVLLSQYRYPPLFESSLSTTLVLRETYVSTCFH